MSICLSVLDTFVTYCEFGFSHALIVELDSPKMAGHLVIKLIQQWPDGGVHLIKTKKALITQPRQNPALCYQNSTLDLCFVFGLSPNLGR